MSNAGVVLLSWTSSNCFQAPVYTSAIENTINASSQDFIDAGISLDILDSLKLVPPNESLTLVMARQVGIVRSRGIPLATTHVPSAYHIPVLR
jgi:hypothetical protein